MEADSKVIWAYIVTWADSEENRANIFVGVDAEVNLFLNCLRDGQQGESHLYCHWGRQQGESRLYCHWEKQQGESRVYIFMGPDSKVIWA